MAWAADQTFGVYHRPELVRVSSRAYQTQRVVTMPAADVRAGNTYAFILTGTLGAFTPLPFGDAVAEVTLEAGTSIYQVQHRMDMSLPLMQTAWGHPYMILIVVPSASAQDYSLVFRADGGEASIDAPALQVWDMTLLGSAGASAFNSVPTQLLGDPATKLLQGPTLTPNKHWLVYWSAEVEQKAWYETPAIVPPVGGCWLTRYGGSSTLRAKYPRTYYSGTGPVSSHIGCGPRAATKERLDRKYTRIRIGDWSYLHDPSGSLTPAVWGQSLLGVGQTGITVLHDIVRRVDMVCIDLDAAAKGILHTKVDASARLFPGSEDDLIGTRGEPRSLVRGLTTAFPYSQEGAMLGTVRAGSFSREAPRKYPSTANFSMSFDAADQSPRGWVADEGNAGLSNTLYTLLMDTAECLPTHRVLTPRIDRGGHCVRWDGRQNGPTNAPVEFWPSFYDAEWLLMLPRSQFAYAEPQPPVPGPEVVVKVRKESPTDISSLPLLPPGYSNVLEFEASDPVDDFRSEAGYLHRLPRFATPRRPVRITYAVLDQRGMNEVEGFLRRLVSTHGCFRFTPPDVYQERAYTLDVSQGWEAEKLPRHNRYRVSFRAIELVYTP